MTAMPAGAPADDPSNDRDGERELVRRASSESDPEAFAVLYRRHVEAVHAYAFRCCGSRDVAEDVTASTFERAIRSLPSFEWREAGLRPWLFRIAANEVAAWYRNEQRSESPRAQMILQELATAEDEAATVGATEDSSIRSMRTALEHLRPRFQQAITLRYLGGLSADDAARAMGCSKAVLAVTLHRGLAALKTQMRVSVNEMRRAAPR